MSNSFVKNAAYTLLDLVTLKKGVVRTINGMKIRFPAKWSRYYPVDYENENYLFLQKTVSRAGILLTLGLILVYSVHVLHNLQVQQEKLFALNQRRSHFLF